jgi:hypothetical protein
MSENLTVYWFNLPFHVCSKFFGADSLFESGYSAIGKLIEIAAVLHSPFFSESESFDGAHPFVPVRALILCVFLHLIHCYSALDAGLGVL